MSNAVIVDYVRTPFVKAFDPTNPDGKRGALAYIRPDDMVAELIIALLARNKGLDTKDIETVLTGSAFPEAEQGLNVARLIGMKAGLPDSVGGVTLNRFCGSSMQAIHDATAHIISGAGDLFLCTGVESMSRIPMGGWNPLPNPSLHARRPEAYISMGLTAENVAAECNITRTMQDAFALSSHRKAAAAQANGLLKREIITLNHAPHIYADDNIRADSTLEVLSRLRPAFKTAGTVTAGTSSPITDGASAVLVTSEDYARKHGLQPLARIISFAGSGCRADVMGLGPVSASQKALARAGLKMSDIDITERGLRRPGGCLCQNSRCR
jgi:acetyl-CoA acyltransferase